MDAGVENVQLGVRDGRLTLSANHDVFLVFIVVQNEEGVVVTDGIQILAEDINK